MEVALCRDMNWLQSEKAFSIYASCMYQPTYEAFRYRMKNYVSDPLVKIYVCTEGDGRIGILVLQAQNDEAEIIGVAVSNHMRNRGMGRHIILRAMELEGLKCMKAQTDDDSIGFYRSCGFRDERTVVEYPDGKAVRYNCILQLMDLFGDDIHAKERLLSR